MKTPEGVTYFQLRYLYRLLYGKAWHRDEGACVLQRSALIAPDEENSASDNPLAPFLIRPAYKRLLVPAVAGKVQLAVSESDDHTDLDSGDSADALSVRSGLNFVKLHFSPLYDKWQPYIEGTENSSTLQDLMGRKQISEGKVLQKRRNRDSDIGAGAGLKDLLLSFIRDDNANGLQMLRNTQSSILAAYGYSPITFHESSINFFKEAKKYEDPYSRFSKEGILDEVERIVMDLFSYCRDDSALTVMLVSTVLRERVGSILRILASHPCMESVSFSDSFEQRCEELGNGYYISYQRHSNYMGGKHDTDITLFKEPGCFIRKITDVLGYFFVAPKLEDAFLRDRGVNIVNYRSSISAFRNGLALFTWQYQPDGRYWEDDTGFGRTNDNEIVVYSLLNTSGEFVLPFSTKKPAGWEDEGNI